MNQVLPVHISFRNGPSQISLGSTVEEVIETLGEPSEAWNDGVEAYVGYTYPTHELSFEFKVAQAPPHTTSAVNCEIWVHNKMQSIKSYDVLSSDYNGCLKRVYKNLSLTEAKKHMTLENKKHGIATHWLSYCTSEIEANES